MESPFQLRLLSPMLLSIDTLLSVSVFGNFFKKKEKKERALQKQKKSLDGL